MESEPASASAVSVEEGAGAAGTLGKTEEESGERAASDAGIWDLPLSLAGKIASYGAGTTADVAKLREVSRAFGQTIRGQISSKSNVNHTIACPNRLGRDKSFVPALTTLGWEGDEQYIIPGDFFGGNRIDHQRILSGNVSLKCVMCLGDGGEGDGVDTQMPIDGADGKNALASEIVDVISRLQNVNSMGELELIRNDAKSRGLFAPIKRGGDAHGDDRSICSDEYNTQMVMTEFTVPEDSDCIVATAETYLELETSDVSNLSSDVHPMHPKSVYIAPISEVMKFGDGKVLYRVSVLLEIIYEYDIGEAEDFISSLSYEVLKQEHQNRIGPVEGVAVVDDLLGEDFVQTLTSNIDALTRYQEEQNAVDYHPHSKNIVRDIVHPGLYSYVKGVSELRASVRGAKPCSLPSYEPDGDSESTSSSAAEMENDGYGEGIADFWGRNEWDKYQWLPTYFGISSTGDCNIEHYINGLTPRSDGVNANLHNSLAKLFEHALPYINSVYSYVRAVRPLIREDSDEEDYHDYDEKERGELNVTPYNLKGHKLQVITKIVDYELNPGQSHEGVWHVEGMSQEDIVLTVLYILDREECISGGDIMFKRAFLADEAASVFWNISQCRPLALEKEIENGLVPLGKVETKKGRLVVFPNSHVHKVTEMINDGIAENAGDKAGVSRRRIVVFFLVNPLRRIVSTREVAPQKGGSMSHEEALKHRLELMKVRKYHKQDWNVREIHLCEH